MPTPTYTPLATTTLVSAASSVNFSSIPATYRDLVVVADFIPALANGDCRLRFNSDTGGDYNFVQATGNGSTTNSSTSSNQTQIGGMTSFITTSASKTNYVIQIFDYAQTNKHKSVLIRYNDPAKGVVMVAARWASTAAITAVNLFNENANFTSGSTLSLYGIIS
jgi:hypothetical protein